MPEGWYGRVSGRFSMASDEGLLISSSIIEYNAPDEIRLVVFNMNPKPYKLDCGRQIAQLVIGRCTTPPLRQVYRKEENPRKQ
jgi:dUTP pyrophosphatase